MFESLHIPIPIWSGSVGSVLTNPEFEKKVAERNFCLFFEKISTEATLSENAMASISVLT